MRPFFSADALYQLTLLVVFQLAAHQKILEEKTTPPPYAQTMLEAQSKEMEPYQKQLRKIDIYKIAERIFYVDLIPEIFKFYAEKKSTTFPQKKI